MTEFGINILEIIEALSKQDDGHFTIFKFTTHWKVMIGTPDLNGNPQRELVNTLPKGKTLEKALLDMLSKETRYYENT